MLLLGYDGTLVPFQTIPILAKPTSQVMRLLEELCAAGNLVTVASGRDKETMRSWFRSIPGIGLVAEFGLFYRYAASAGLDRSVRPSWADLFFVVGPGLPTRKSGSVCRAARPTTWTGSPQWRRS